MSIRVNKEFLKVAILLGLGTIKEYENFIKNLKKLAQEVKNV